jgi:membrane protein
MSAKFVFDLKRFFKETIWNTPLNSLSKRKQFVYRQVRIFMITFSEFNKNKCSDKASALTYFSLLSVVPVAAMAFGIATIFSLDEYLKEELERYFAGQQEVLEYTLDFADKMLATSSGGVISGISAIFLLYAVARLLNNIEKAFNDIWNTEQGRSLKRKVTDYMSFMLLGPIILVVSGSMSVFITDTIWDWAEGMRFFGFFRPVISVILNAIPYSLIWLLLCVLYIVFPNATVKFRPALIAGILAGTAFQVTQLLWIKGQVFLSNYSVVYGSFAALPLFLIWLQISWTILLLGAEYSFALQHHFTWNYSDEKEKLSRRLKRRLIFIVLHKIIKEFDAENGPISAQRLSSELFIPNRFIQEVFLDLEDAKLISRVKRSNDDGDEYYLPCLDINKIDIQQVIRRLDEIGVSTINKLEMNEAYFEVDAALIQLEEDTSASKGNIILKNL